MTSISLVAIILILGSIAPSSAAQKNRSSGFLLMTCDNAVGKAIIVFTDSTGNFGVQIFSCDSDEGPNSIERYDQDFEPEFVDVILELRDLEGDIVNFCDFIPTQEHENNIKYSCESISGDHSTTLRIIT